MSMTQPDWSKAPAGATHWGPDSHTWREAWYMFSQDRLWRWHNGIRWGLVPKDAPRFSDRIAELVPKPAKPLWRYHWGGPGPKQWGKVDVLSRNGEINTGINARLVSWSHPWQEGEDSGEDIIAYRLPYER